MDETVVDGSGPDGGQAVPLTLSRTQVLLVIFGLMLGMLLAALDQTIVATALPTIVGDLGGLSHLSWVATAYLLATTATTQAWGMAGPRPRPAPATPAPRAPGHRRRWPARADPGDHRRRRPAARTRQVPGRV